MRYWLAIIFSILIHQAVYAQSGGGEITNSSAHLWNELDLTHAYKKVVVEGDLFMSHSNDSNNRYQIRKHFFEFGAMGWAHYYLTPRMKLSAGISYWQNLDVPEISQTPTKEFRPNFQAQHFIVRKQFTVFNRLRLENRFVENSITKKNTFTNRLRYMPKVFVALNSKSIRKKTVYFIASDEIVMTLGNSYLIDQNRATIGFGYCFTNDIVLEACYTNQYNLKEDAPREIINAFGLTLSVNNIMRAFQKK